MKSSLGNVNKSSSDVSRPLVSVSDLLSSSKMTQFKVFPAEKQIKQQ